MTKQNILSVVLFLAFLGIFIAGCSQSLEQKPVAEKTGEEVTDTGILSVKSVPSSAQVYVDGELKGDSPFTVYNIPAGTHDLVVKKEGYVDFEKKVIITVGRTEDIESTLTPVKTVQNAVEENKSMAEKVPENPPSLSPKLNTVNLSKSFIIYYDFSKGLFTDTTSGFPDVFSSNYGTYIYFTAMAPARLGLLKKEINDVHKQDCINADDGFVNLYSGQTVCVKTTEGLIAAIGGSWKDTASGLQWVLFN